VRGIKGHYENNKKDKLYNAKKALCAFSKLGIIKTFKNSMENV
jgi:hypothetical protein